MFSHFFLIMPIELNIKLSLNQNLIFKLKQLNTLTLSIYIINHHLSRFIIRNNINLLITLSRHTRLSKILKYEIIGCFQIDLKHTLMTERFVKTIFFRHLIK